MRGLRARSMAARNEGNRRVNPWQTGTKPAVFAGETEDGPNYAA